MRALEFLFLLAVLAVIAYGAYRVVRFLWRRTAAGRTARSRWSVETRPKPPYFRVGTSMQRTVGERMWQVVLRRPGEEQVFREVRVGDDDGLLEAQADAEAHAHVLNEGRRKS